MRSRSCLKNFAFFLTLLGGVATLSACATSPVHSVRKGLFEPPSASSRRSLSSDILSQRTLSDFKLPGKWQWPLEQVEISSAYGERGRKFHQGIDLRASVGTPVSAAADGEVVYVGSKIRGYGRMIVLKHRDGFYTVYAHHSKNLVKLGEKVEVGQVIARSGRSGRVQGPHLHFELRRGAQSIDPEYAFNGHLKSAANRRIASKGKRTDSQETLQD
jgi:murein DD-endopeptidase MepM/ murein hydrolase activator NlpD